MEYKSNFEFDLKTSGLKGENWFDHLLENRKIKIKNEK